MTKTIFILKPDSGATPVAFTSWVTMRDSIKLSYSGFQQVKILVRLDYDCSVEGLEEINIDDVGETFPCEKHAIIVDFTMRLPLGKSERCRARFVVTPASLYEKVEYL